jgi:tetratricopeptide (TPR) repeat protein
MDARDMPDMMGKHDPLDDLITVLLVVVTLFGAAIAWGQAHAHFVHDEAAARAEEWAVLASSQQSRANQAALLQAGRRRQARRDRLGAEQAAAGATLGGGDSPLLALEAGQWKRRAQIAERQSVRLGREEAEELREIEADAALALPDIEPASGRTAPCEAPPKPPPVGMSVAEAASGRGPPAAAESANVAEREGYRMEGLRDAAEETAVQAEEQFTTYAVALAFVAVALFLFGYALTKYGFKFRGLFVVVGLVLTAGAAVVAGIAYSDAPAKPAPSAAAAYADGQVALTHGQLQVALEDFGCATRLNPDFAAAFLGSSLAVDQRGMSRDVAVINEGLQSDENLRKALKYGRRARRINPDDPRALGQIATALYVYGVSERDRGDLRRALALYDEMEEELPRDPIAAFNAGASRLALGRDWRRRYRLAGRLMERASQGLEYVGGALTDLDALQRSHLWPGIAAAAREAKEEVVGAATSEVPPDADAGKKEGGASLRLVQLFVTPVAADVSFAARRFHPLQEGLFIAIYRRQARGWQELQQLSGAVTDLAPSVDGRYGTVLHYASRTSCLGSGTYKVELYVDGRLANVDGVAEETARLPQLTLAQTLSGMNVKLCAPAGRDWRPISRRSVGLVDGFERPGRRRAGISVFDLSARPARDSRALALKRFSPPLPSGAEQVGPAAPGAPGEDLADASTTIYRYPRGAMALVVGTTPIGRRLAIAVFGPPAFFTARPGMSLSPGQSLVYSVSSQDVSPFTADASAAGG